MEKVVLQYIITLIGDFSYLLGIALYALALVKIVQDIDSRKIIDSTSYWHLFFFCIMVEYMVLLSIWGAPAENSIIPSHTKIVFLIVMYGSILWLIGIVYTFCLAMKFAKNNDICIIMSTANAIFLFLLFLSLQI